ncbi:MAG TPA: ribosome recycling factor [Firmicutes bacterium]|nr:ribosome recycling factor [Candidatus Fermentithermobacillaceae bacterium]
MDQKTLMTQVEGKMKNVIETYKRDLASLRAGRATPLLLERVVVDYYGIPTPINQVASIGVSPPRTLVVQPWDKNLVVNIEKAIQKSDLGAMPVNDGSVVRVTIPPLSGDRRRELIKTLRKDSEAQKVLIRNIRRSAMDEIKQAEKDREISEDLSRRIQDRVQKLTDEYIKLVDEITSTKEAEVMEV